MAAAVHRGSSGAALRWGRRAAAPPPANFSIYTSSRYLNRAFNLSGLLQRSATFPRTMASAAGEQHAARDFHAICSTSATILTEAICAINALSLHLHGALGPGFDPEQVLDCAGVEDILTAPMKRRLILRRSLSLSHPS
jgi:hypothetical protein